MRFTFIASGNGGFSKFVYNHLHLIQGAEFGLVFSDRECACADWFRANTDVPVVVVDYRTYPTREAYEEVLLRTLQDHGIDYAFLAYKLLIGPAILEAYADRMINIHLSLLPEYIGANAVRRSFDDDRFIYGSTIHLIDESVDEGPVLSQVALGRDFSESFKAYDNRLYRATSAMILDTIHKLVNRGIVRSPNPLYVGAEYGHSPFNPKLDIDYDALRFDAPLV